MYLTHAIDIGNANQTEKSKYKVPFVSTFDVETLCHCILEFIDVSAPASFNLSNGPLCFTYFHQCLGGSPCNCWDVIVPAHAPIVAGFTHGTLPAFLSFFIHHTDYADQIHYLNHKPKPYDFSCLELTSHLEFLNHMLGLFPGAPINLPLADAELKHIFYSMMCSNWQCALIWKGHDINNAMHTLMDLAQHIQDLEGNNSSHNCNHNCYGGGSHGNSHFPYFHGGFSGQAPYTRCGCSSCDSDCHHSAPPDYQQGPLAQ